MAKGEKSFNPPWALVIIMLAAFWPVGLYLLWRKLCAMQSVNSQKRNRRMTNGAIAMVLLGLLTAYSSRPATGIFLLAGGAALLAYEFYLKRRDARFQRFKAYLGDRPTASLEDIASAMGVSPSACQNTLEAMLQEGVLPKGAYLDVGRGLYVRHSRYAPQEAPDPAPQAASAPKDQPGGKAKSAGQAAQASGAAQQGVPSPEEMEYLDKLAQLRQVNQSIQSEKVSAQIERIQHITGNIFDIVVEHPEKRGQIHTFMNYYLPTALKLLCAYARLEKQKVAGENIQNSKEAIEKLLDQLVWAFERQNDQMFAADAMDIQSDIKVMQTMMARDGLSQSALDGRPFAAAARRPTGA